jgi:hypothetical protein
MSLIEHVSYHHLLNQTLEERGLNKNILHELLLYYTHVLMNTGGLKYLCEEPLTPEQVSDSITAFIDANPLTIDTILRYK